jgi:hypothetical protein
VTASAGDNKPAKFAAAAAVSLGLILSASSQVGKYV